MGKIYGYNGQVLRVNLSTGQTSVDHPDEDTLRKYIGGSGLGARYLYDEVPPGVAWSDPENRLILATGPLGGTQVPGSGTYSVVTKGALTNGATATQANGFFGAFLRFSGFEGVVVHGKSEKLVYLYIHDGIAEIRDASHLAGKNVVETERTIKSELGYKNSAMSVVAIGPAGENIVRFASIAGDNGHVAGHNGTGAVMGSKRLKAIAAARSDKMPEMKNPQLFAEKVHIMRERIRTDRRYAAGSVKEYGTLNVYQGMIRQKMLPYKNFTTNEFDYDQFSKFNGEYIRGNYSPKLHPCWGCPMHHCHVLTIPDGRHAGEVVDEPEYEGLASWSSVIGQSDLAEAIHLSELVDQLGMDTNEASWTVSLVMECYEKGLLSKNDTDGLEMNWGNVDATEAILNKIARREGIGNLLADGAMRAAQKIGKGAEKFAIHTMKGNTPRNHDHRVNWRELFDTSVSNTGTLEAAWQVAAPNYEDLGLSPLSNPVEPTEVSTFVAKMKGGMIFEDSLSTCFFCTQGSLKLLAEMVSAATGWDYTMEDALNLGYRVTNLLRVFNLNHGIPASLDRPSPRYGSTPIDGVRKGIGIGPVMDDMLQNYYKLMGWDTETGRPLPETLARLDVRI